MIGSGSLIILIATGGTITIGGVTYGNQMTFLIPVLSAFSFMSGFMCFIIGYFEGKKEEQRQFPKVP